MAYAPDSAVDTIVIHYSATPIEREYSYAQLERDHKARGFREGGYHFYFPRKGGVVKGRDLSQPGRFEIGAHSKGENGSSIGLCFEGGVTSAAPDTGHDTRTSGQIKEMIRMIDAMHERFPGALVKGHRDMPGAATQCPGFDATAWWDGVVSGRAKPSLWALILKLFGGTK